MNLYLWCKGTQKYSDCGIRKYKKNKRGRNIRLYHQLWGATRAEADEFESSFRVMICEKSNHYF